MIGEILSISYFYLRAMQSNRTRNNFTVFNILRVGIGILKLNWEKKT